MVYVYTSSVSTTICNWICLEMKTIKSIHIKITCRIEFACFLQWICNLQRVPLAKREEKKLHEMKITGNKNKKKKKRSNDACSLNQLCGMLMLIFVKQTTIYAEILSKKKKFQLRRLWFSVWDFVGRGGGVREVLGNLAKNVSHR